MELTPECEKDLDAVTDAAGLHRFHLKYGPSSKPSPNPPRLFFFSIFLIDDCFLGQFFPTRVELGGRLYFSQETKAVQGSDSQSKAKAMKAAASLSFSSPYVQGSASASHEAATDIKTESTLSRLDNSITWHANGGDPLLCNKYVSDSFDIVIYSYDG